MNIRMRQLVRYNPTGEVKFMYDYYTNNYSKKDFRRDLSRNEFTNIGRCWFVDENNNVIKEEQKEYAVYIYCKENSLSTSYFTRSKKVIDEITENHNISAYNK